jgi:RNA polymerase primary sigma factor
MVQTKQSSASTMDLYMADMARYPLLSAEQEIAFARQYERGRKAESRLDDPSSLSAPERKELESAAEQGQRARQRLIQCNLRLVVSMAHKYSGLGLPVIDLVQEGNIGLMEAVERYDPDQGFRFATYAGWWIKQAIRRAVTNKGRLVRLPAHVSEELSRLRRATKEIEAQHGRRPTPQELSKRLGMPVHKVRRLLRLQQRRVLSLQMPVGDEGDSELGDLIADPDTPPMEEIYAQRHMRESVQDVVTSRLSPREQEVLRMRFGLDGSETRTLQHVADALHISRERVRQIETKALRRLRYARARHELRRIWAQI